MIKPGKCALDVAHREIRNDRKTACAEPPADGRADRRLPVKAVFESLFSHPGFREGRVWQRRVCAANETVIREGQRGAELFQVRRGTVRVTGSAALAGGGAIHPGYCDLGAGEVFGESGLLPGLPRTASVITVTDCELAVIDAQALLAFLEAHPATGYAVLLALFENTTRRLDQTNRRLLRILAWGLRAHEIEPHLDADPGAAIGGTPRVRKTG